MTEPTTEAPDRRRRTFGPVVLAGLAASALAAVASAKPWLGAGTSGGSQDASLTALDQGTRDPLASAVSLVLLAAWGVLLVTRGGVRRTFAVIATVAAVGLVATVVTGDATLPGQAKDSFDQAMGRVTTDTGFTGWFWAAAVTSVIAVVVGAYAVRLVPHWPEMGSRYDAPVGDSATESPAAQVEEESFDSERDLWNALDEGKDPTDGRG